MPKIYYRCINCGTTKHLKGEVIVTDMSYKYCPNCREITGICKVFYNYWWELLYITIRTIFRTIKEAWRVYLEYNRQIKKFSRRIK